MQNSNNNIRNNNHTQRGSLRTPASYRAPSVRFQRKAGYRKARLRGNSDYGNYTSAEQVATRLDI